MDKTPDVVEIASELIKRRSLSGDEQRVAEYIFGLAEEWGFDCQRQSVEPGRDNLFLCMGSPSIVLSTHMDIVPAPEALFTPRIDKERLFGRGACDAKGILAAMLCAAYKLKQIGANNFGLLFVVGEESGGVGARAASQSLAKSNIKWIINGEPTEGLLMLGHKGTLYFELRTTGRACHSGYPHLGENAIAKLVSVLGDLCATDFGHDPFLGQATLNIGEISGGVASNILAPSARATILIRTVSSGSEAEVTLRGLVNNRAEIVDLETIDPVRLESVEGFKTGVAAYCTDIPNLAQIGAKFLLFGPGSIHVAHTDHENIEIKELQDAVESYVALVQKLQDS